MHHKSYKKFRNVEGAWKISPMSVGLNLIKPDLRSSKFPGFNLKLAVLNLNKGVPPTSFLLMLLTELFMMAMRVLRRMITVRRR